MSWKLTLVFAPLVITRRLIVNAGQETEAVERNLFGSDAQLVIQLPLRRSTYPLYGGVEIGADLAGNTKWVRTTCVCPGIC